MKSDQTNQPLIITAETITQSTMETHKACTALHAPNAHTVQARACEFNTFLQSVSLPNASIIGVGAFSNTNGLTSLKVIDIPKVTSISMEAFRGSGLTNVDAPSAVTIKLRSFAQCHNLKSASLPQATFIDATGFYDCPKLTSISIPQVESIGHAAFACTNVTLVEAPKVREIGKYSFQFCMALQTFVAPQATHIAKEAFFRCPQLKQVYLPKTQDIGSDTFKKSPNLKKLLIPQDLITAHHPETDRTWWLSIGIDPKKTTIDSLDAWAERQNITLSDTDALFILYRLNQDPDYRPTWPELGRACPNLPFHLLLKVLPEDKYAQTLPLLSEATIAVTKPQGGKAKNELLASYFHDINIRTSADVDSSEKVSHTEAHKAESHEKEAATHTSPIEFSEAIEPIAKTLTIKDMAKIMLAKANEPRLSKDKSLFTPDTGKREHDNDTQNDAKPNRRGRSAAA